MRGVDRSAYRRLALPRFLFVVAALFAALPLVVAGNVLVGSLVAVRLSLLGVEPLRAGIVLALYSVGFVFGSRYAVPVVFRVGHIRAFAAFAAITCCQALAYPLLESVLAWSVWRLLGGATVAGLMAVVESWISARATQDNRGRLLSGYLFVFYLASAGGQFLVGVTGVSGFAPYSLAAMLIALSAVPLALGRTEAPVSHAVERLGMRALYRQVPLGVVGSLFAGVLMGGFVMLGPYYAWESGMAAGGVAAFMTTAVLAAMAFQLPVGWLSDRVGRLRVFVAVVLVTLIATLVGAMPHAAGAVTAYVAAAAFTGAAAALYPLSLAIVHDNLSQEQVLPANAAVLYVYGIGTCIGPVGGAYAMRLGGAPGLFGFLASATAMLLVFTWVRLRAPQLRDAERGEFVPVPQVATPVLAEIDPRAEAPAETAQGR